VIQSKFVTAAGFRTHYLEAGAGYPVVLLHSGEFGACAEVSWEFAVQPLAEHYRVVAPDWLGFGQSEKVFSFEDMRALRISHIAAFLQELGIDDAHFIGNSMGGGQLARAAVMDPCPFPINKMVLAGAGGDAPKNAAREILNRYDGTLESMREAVEVLVRRPELRNDPEYVARRHALSLEPGAWEATAAARLKMPGRPPSAGGGTLYGAIPFPTLIVAGAHDPLRHPGFGQALHAQIAGSQLEVFEDSGHSPHLDEPERFIEVVLRFLT
jgi:pimeloyl-ACP methyl ester carboxylesterase